jgi:membrane protease YdiL (CAAX protease family)
LSKTPNHLERLMNTSANPQPGVFLRILRFPLTRLILQGGLMLVLYGLAGGFMQKFAGSPPKTLAAIVAMVTLGFAVYIGFVHFVERRPVSELALPGAGRELGIGLLIGAGLYTACVLILMLLGIYRIDGTNSVRFMLPALAMALSSGVFEELLFRGVLFRIIEESLGSWVALLISCLLFGFMHLVNPQGTIEGALFISIEAGVLLAAAYMLTRRLWLSMGFHFAWNYTQSGIFSGIVSGNDAAQGLIKATITGPDVLTGGSFGLESSLIAFLLCTSTGVILLIMAIRQGKIVPPFWKRKA